MKELRVDMPYNTVEAVIEKHHKEFIIDVYPENAIVLRVSIGFCRYCFLTASFNDDKLEFAGIRGEGGPKDIFKDAPVDLGRENLKTRNKSGHMRFSTTVY